jgi:hypothetical protein
MLKDVWECEEAAFSGDDIPHVLHRWATLLTAEDFRKPVVLVLFVSDVFSISIRLLAE